MPNTAANIPMDGKWVTRSHVGRECRPPVLECPFGPVEKVSTCRERIELGEITWERKTRETEGREPCPYPM